MRHRAVSFRLGCFALAGLFLLVGEARAQVATWDQGVSGNWSDAARWREGVVPDNGPGDSFMVLITEPPVGGPGDAYIVSLDIDATITDLTLDVPDLDLGTRELTLAGDGTRSLTIEGDALLSDAAIQNLAGLTIQGSLTFDSSGCDEICDTPILVTGSASATWTGLGAIEFLGTASMTVDTGASFAIDNDQTMTGALGTFLDIRGALVKDIGVGTTDLSGIELINTGSVEVRTGTLRADTVTLAGGDTLATGTWSVLNGSTLDFAGQAITTNQADVVIQGSGASFADLTNNLLVNDTSGNLTLDIAAILPTAGDFTNDGSLTLAAGTTLDVTGALTNFDAGTSTLSGGDYSLAGTLEVDAIDVQTLDAGITLVGPGGDLIDPVAGLSGVRNLNRIASGGSLELQSRTFTTVGDFAVDTTGRLAVAGDATFTVNGDLTNFDTGTGTFTDGVFEVLGTLQADNMDIQTLAGDITLDGPASQFIDGAGLDGFRSLSLIDTAGRLALRGGKTLDLGTDLTVLGTLQIDDSGGPRPIETTLTVSGPVVLDDADARLIMDGGTLIAPAGVLVNDGRIIGSGKIVADVVMGPDTVLSPDRLQIAADAGGAHGVIFGQSSVLEIQIGRSGGSLLSDLLDISGSLDGEPGILRISIRGSAPVPGDVFLVATYGLLLSEFGRFDPRLGGLEAFTTYTDDSLFITIVPDPGVAGVLALWGTIAIRRRRA